MTSRLSTADRGQLALSAEEVRQAGLAAGFTTAKEVRRARIGV